MASRTKSRTRRRKPRYAVDVSLKAQDIRLR
jgi:hypothetical protein